jgi:hypothetical protein
VRAAATAAGGESPSFPSPAGSILPPDGAALAAALRSVEWATRLLGFALLVAPVKLLELAFLATPGNAVTGLAYVLGGSLLLVAVVAQRLADAALGGLLASATYKRLSLGLAGWGAVSAIAAFSGPVALAAAAWGSVIVLAGAAMAVGGASYRAAADRPLLEEPAAVGRALLGALPGLVSYSSVSTAVYSLGAKASALLVAACWTGGVPVVRQGLLAVPVGPLGLTLLRFQAAALLLLAVVLYTLADAATRGRLGASTFRALNAGVGAAALAGALLAARWVQQGVLVLGPSAPAAVRALASTNLGLVAALGAVALYNAAAAKK